MLMVNPRSYKQVMHLVMYTPYCLAKAHKVLSIGSCSLLPTVLGIPTLSGKTNKMSFFLSFSSNSGGRSTIIHHHRKSLLLPLAEIFDDLSITVEPS